MVQDPIELVNRAGPRAVALETTLLLHGVPRADAPGLTAMLRDTVRARGAFPAFTGVFRGVPTVGLTDAELAEMLEAGDVPKVNTANLGVLVHRRGHGATTVSTTLELAARAGVRIFATGGIGGVHRGYSERLDISSDLAALARFPVAVVTSGVKSILDVASTREALETLGVPVVGFRADEFPAFYRRGSGCAVDARFDDAADLASFVRSELSRTARGVVIAHPIPAGDEISAGEWDRWLGEAENAAAKAGVVGRAVTPFVLAELHRVSGGATLRANIALVRSNAELAADLARLLRPA